MTYVDTDAKPDKEAAKALKRAGLRYVSDDEPGLTRKAGAKGFTILDARGRPVKDVATLDRVRKLAIPPAYTDVWICADDEGHIQATGRDARGRKQYRYHASWNELRDADKYGRMADFGSMLPKLRARIDAHMRRKGLGRRKVLATVAHLLDTTLIRIGNEDYAKANKSYGLTTLRNRHVDVGRESLRFEFKGKSGKMWKLQVRDRRIARIVRQAQELPGQHLFQYVDKQGRRHAVTSSDVNAYLREIAGEEITAKDFRTWAGTVLAAEALVLCEPFTSPTGAKKNVKSAIAHVASRLGNTPTVCRKCYVHPHVVEHYLGGLLVDSLAAAKPRRRPPRLKPEEAAVLGLLRGELAIKPAAKRKKPVAQVDLRTQMTASLARPG